jgi:hypothetical protein
MEVIRTAPEVLLGPAKGCEIAAFPEDSESVSEGLFPGFRRHLSETFKDPARQR